MNEIRILDGSGDRSGATWDPADPHSVVRAKGVFDTLHRAGYILYQADKNGAKGGVLMHSFDPEATTVVASPRVVGG